MKHFLLNVTIFAPVLLALSALIAHPFHINPLYIFAPVMAAATVIFAANAYEAR